MIMGVIANFVSLLSDIIVILVLMLGLFLVNLALGLSSVIFFGLLGLGLYKYTNSNAKLLGHQEVTTSFDLNKLATTALILNKEMTAVSRKIYFTRLFEEKKRTQASILARKAFLPNISKYVLEIGLVAGTMLIAAFQFLITDAKHAVAFVAIFLVSGTRIGPALLRAHQSLLIVSASLGASTLTLKLIDEYNLLPEKIKLEESPSISDEESFPGLEDGKLVIAENLSFTYPGADAPIFSHLDLSLRNNTLTVFVGKSGSGKTTALDLLAGINLPTQGTLNILGHTPRNFASKFPGSISYLPQETKIFDATIRENICVGYKSDFFSDDDVWKALEESQLKEFVKQMEGGLDHRLVENGRGMSGGQKQRIGIARSLITRPKLLLMDEPTSALDSETESGFLDIIKRLKSSTTLVIATHRLQILELADYTFFFEANGEVSELHESAILEKLKD
jgi:ABC-type multidrug transport system fused ATPase/permease subunit